MTKIASVCSQVIVIKLIFQNRGRSHLAWLFGNVDPTTKSWCPLEVTLQILHNSHLDLVRKEVMPFDPLTQKTLPRNKHKVDQITRCIHICMQELMWEAPLRLQILLFTMRGEVVELVLRM